jgi:hypothetical protein
MPDGDVIHQCPPAGQDGEPGSSRVPCCNMRISDMGLWRDRITNDPSQVTCKGDQNA